MTPITITGIIIAAAGWTWLWYALGREAGWIQGRKAAIDFIERIKKAMPERYKS